LKEKPTYNAHEYVQDGGLFLCKHSRPKANYMQGLFIEVYSRCNLARDGMTGSLNYNAVLEIAKINGLDGENLNDLMDFINECESARIKENNKKKD
jgi:hypothetical protein